MPGWLIPRLFVCDCGVTYPAVTPRSKRCPDCQYKFVLAKNQRRRHKGPFVFDCRECGVQVVSPFQRQRYCRDCMRPHAAWLERLNRAKWAPSRKILHVVQCADCGSLIYDAFPSQKRCPGCQLLREAMTGVPWRPLHKTGRPIDCEGCGAPVIKFHSYRRFCNECRRKIALRDYKEYRERIKRDPFLAGQDRARRQFLRRRRRQEISKLMRNPQLIEQAVLDQLEQLIGVVQ